MSCVKLALAFLFLTQTFASEIALPAAGNLKFVVTVEQPVVASPLGARVTLHLHNSGDKTLWLYRPVTAPKTGERSKDLDARDHAAHTIEGSTLAVRLEGEGGGEAARGTGEIFITVGMPRPKLVRLGPGEDEEIKTVVKLLPAQMGIGEATRPIWGRYKFSATYAAKYSNGNDLERILGVTIWQGEVESNAVVLDLQPPPATALQSITGTVVNATNLPLDGILVSLTDKDERLLNQTVTDLQGKYAFTHLTPGFYWVTIRRKEATEDTAIFRHIVLTPSDPAETIDFELTTAEVFEPKHLMHKPVLIEVVDGAGAPLANVGFESTWSSGTVLENVKGVTASDGVVSLELLPGANYATLKRHGCPKDDERINVAEGPGIDGFKMVFNCAKK